MKKILFALFLLTFVLNDGFCADERTPASTNIMTSGSGGDFIGIGVGVIF